MFCHIILSKFFVVNLQMRAFFTDDGLNTGIIHSPRESSKKDASPKTQRDGNNNDETPSSISPDISPSDFYEHSFLFIPLSGLDVRGLIPEVSLRFFDKALKF